MSASATALTVVPPNPPYPARLDAEYPQHLNRLLIFVKGILLIPHYVALMFVGVGAFVAWVASWWAVLFTGRYPEGLFRYMAGALRWGHRVTAYHLLVTDRYPPFSLEDDPSYPVRVEVDYPARIARWRPLLNWLLVIPAGIAAAAIMMAAYFAVIVAWFAILFTGRYPEGIFRLVALGLRWSLRVTAFHYWMIEPYPPFVWA